MTDSKPLTQEQPAKCDWREFITASPETESGMLETLDSYFSHFCAVGSDCPSCGSKVFGDSMVDALFATFTWGLVHGEGHCSKCGWPARLYHFIKDKDGNEVATLRNVGLICHPDFVEKREPS